MRRLSPPALLVALALASPAAAQTKVTWKKTVVDPAFRAEGVAVADVNKDGKPDLIVGDCWYEAPSWKRHVIRQDKKYDPKGYSESFCCFADDFSGDGWVDVVVIPFPGLPCYWYENPGATSGPWKAHLLTNSACNETPIFIDLFKTGKKVLVMGWQPERDDKKGNHDDRGEMCWFSPGKDPKQPWERHSISGPSVSGKKEVPGTRRFSHGLGHGDVNGDGRLDVICTGGWWEQPAKAEGGTPWPFHAATLSNGCADMHATDLDGDKLADIVCSAPHWYGFWWFKQQPGKDSPAFVQRDIFPPPAALAKEPTGYTLTNEEKAVFAQVNKLRDARYRRAPFPASAELCRMARDHAERLLKSGASEANIAAGDYKGKVAAVVSVAKSGKPAEELLKELEKGIVRAGSEVGIGYAKAGEKEQYTLIVGDRGQFSLPSATHALHYVDIDGDGVKDFVTGRRYWAHAPNAEGSGGDAGVNDPAYLYWFKGKKGSDGVTTFTPMLIDDDSGVGTQFEVVDINGDGIPDIVICNKRGLFVFEQVRAPATDAAPPRRD